MLGCSFSSDLLMIYLLLTRCRKVLVLKARERSVLQLGLQY